MKKYNPIPIITALLALIMLPAMSSAVTVGNFEGGSLDGWEPASSAPTVTLSHSTEGAAVGAGSLKVTNSGSGYSWGAIVKNIAGDPAAIAALSQPGAAVTIDFLAKDADVMGPALSLSFLVNGDNGGSPQNEQMANTTVTTDGTTHTVKFELTDSARAILARSSQWAFIGFSDNSSAARTWYVDNIQTTGSSSSPSPSIITPSPQTSSAARNRNVNPPSSQSGSMTAQATQFASALTLDPAAHRRELPNGDLIVGNPEFIHLVRENGTWWFVDHTGKRFISIGMNHVDEGKVLFNEVNDGWLQGLFGDDIKASWGQIDKRATNIGGFADMVVEDFKDYAFNTIPFHSYNVPLNLYEEREIYYIAKIKVQQICLMHMRREQGERFPDVFSVEFENKLDALADKTCTPLRDAKYCLGYTYFDMPDLKSIRNFQRNKFEDKGLIYPWVQDMRALPAAAAGKQKWMSILAQNHASATAAAETFGLSGISTWEELAAVTEWPVEPGNRPLALKDAEDMFTAIAEQWYGLHHEKIKKYDPNHLLIGDKHDVGYDRTVHMIPDGVLKAMGKFTDVLMIQSYTHYAEHHRKMLEELHQKSGLPILNGDHSYSSPTEHQEKTKGIKLESQEAVAQAYYHYMQNSMQNHPYMLGWWHCGYIEQWAPAGTHLGQQCGFFTPFGEPRMDLLPTVKEANEKAVMWHANGGNSSI